MNSLKKEYLFFKQQDKNMRVLLQTNMLYAFVLPIVEIFVGAYIMRNTSSPVMVAYYQLMMYVGIVFTSYINGLLLRYINVKILYAGGILVSGISMFAMMSLKSLGYAELGIAGFVMGAAAGFFWTNRYLLTLNTTTDNNRNYFFGLESFFFSIAGITVPLLIGAFLSQIDGREIFGVLININEAYKLMTFVVVIFTAFICFILWRGKFENPQEKNFIFFRFNVLWNKMLVMSSLKGMVQGFLVTAPAILVMKFVGDEGDLGLIQGISGALTAVLVYVLGRVSKPKHRIVIFTVGMLIFFVGTLANATMFSATGVIIFVLCKVIFQPLFDLAYFPVMMGAIDKVAQIEKRNKYAYILSHEVGLFFGRAFGLILFILLAYKVSQDFALKYALVIVAVLQLLSYPLAKNIIKNSKIDNNNEDN
ncbi:MAG: MFS transporter [Dysgonomonas sp.]